ncbi:PREDICTED: uncharacterized protein LOC108615297 [Drosophila arizonae]|uniref:Uncharacterized protein LOC108615297 n=1 Tax=Drosophila arizonae TaxID=7263 RepID=A0ABM1PD99_DROAR|nr:PREDICTED: uncharacterized protein LOC108615297 [Drosophila arizonae]XP_017865185.1 PREDICTED: uncharacterized protein LOC108615297 [Drosophila arizonae]
MLTRLCCMRLNTAGVVLGWLGIVGSLLGVILLSTILGYADVIAKGIVDKMQPEEATYDEVHSAIVIGCSVYLGIILLNLLSSALLVLGTMKERHLMLLPWLINSAVGLVFSIVYHLALFVAAFSSGADFGHVLPALIPTALILALQIYIYMGIYSLFKQIQQTREQQRPLITATQGMAVPNQGNTYPSYTKI